ncbi:MAG: (E)-4-hydroxy-3-methylbut-2-enyl-diphosphate synthase, partial [Chlorobiales bacterium]|nr:(E)-4-hydroxy-3-methylbut-2-enyl-diphosphate synthase [Chlorobiales bacterium]
MLSYTHSIYNYRRRKTVDVKFGIIGLGGLNPIRVESMTTTDTMDTKATVEQCRQLYEAKCEIIRITAPSIKSAENLKDIRDALRNDGIQTPLVADIHFTPNAAMKAVEYVENVRINPGNYADRKKFDTHDYTDSEYEAELERIHKEFKPLVMKAKEYGVSMRIGTNHGSLSDRIVNRYGDTPLGMVESALEFARICEEYGYYDILFSMKSSNVRVMIEAYRLLVAKADKELKNAYPLHLGVTEAGDGEEGRVKSAMGIGALLEDGLGDTIRVSLTEHPVNEVPIGYAIVKKYNDRLLVQGDRAFEPINHLITSAGNNGEELMPYDPYDFRRRESIKVNAGEIGIGGNEVQRVELEVEEPGNRAEILRDAVIAAAKPFLGDVIRSEVTNVKVASVEEYEQVRKSLEEKNASPALSVSTADIALAKSLVGKAEKIRIDIKEGEMLDKDFLQGLSGSSLIEFSFVKENASGRAVADVLVRIAKKCQDAGMQNVIFSIQAKEIVFAYRHLAMLFKEAGIDYPILIRFDGTHLLDKETVLVEGSVQAGTLFCDGIGDMLAFRANCTYNEELSLAYNILQASRLRLSKTEFISCPYCGRTL